MRTIATPWPGRCVVIEGIAPREWFTPEELELAGNFKLKKRGDEWLLSRAAVKRLAVDMGLAGYERRVSVERPFLLVDGSPTHFYVSLSHSDGRAGAAVASQAVGIDVQVVREIPEQATHLFLSDEETAAMERCTAAHRMLHFWCAKEAAWKREGGRVPTLRQVPLRLLCETDRGLLFDVVETVAIGELVVALTATAGAAP